MLQDEKLIFNFAGSLSNQNTEVSWPIFDEQFNLFKSDDWFDFSLSDQMSLAFNSGYIPRGAQNFSLPVSVQYSATSAEPGSQAELIITDYSFGSEGYVVGAAPGIERPKFDVAFPSASLAVDTWLADFELSIDNPRFSYPLFPAISLSKSKNFGGIGEKIFEKFGINLSLNPYVDAPAPKVLKEIDNFNSLTAKFTHNYLSASLSLVDLAALVPALKAVKAVKGEVDLGSFEIKYQLFDAVIELGLGLSSEISATLDDNLSFNVYINDQLHKSDVQLFQAVDIEIDQDATSPQNVQIEAILHSPVTEKIFASTAGQASLEILSLSKEEEDVFFDTFTFGPVWQKQFTLFSSGIELPQFRSQASPVSVKQTIEIPVVPNKPVLAGEAKRGETLSVDTAQIKAIHAGYIDIFYTWIFDDDFSDIESLKAGTKNETLELTNQHVGKAVSVSIRVIDAKGDVYQYDSDPTEPVTAINHAPTGTLQIVGSPVDGGVLMADTSSIYDLDLKDSAGSLTKPNFSFTWFADDQEIESNGGYLYLDDNHVGKKIHLVATYFDGVAEHGEELISDKTATVENVDNKARGGYIRGDFAFGKTLTVDLSDFEDPDGVEIQGFQWYRSFDGVLTKINGATSKTYVATTDDVMHHLKVEVFYLDRYGSHQVARLDTQSAITYPLKASDIKILGDLRVGEIVTVDLPGEMEKYATIKGARGNEFNVRRSLNDEDFKLTVALSNVAITTEPLEIRSEKSISSTDSSRFHIEGVAREGYTLRASINVPESRWTGSVEWSTGETGLWLHLEQHHVGKQISATYRYTYQNKDGDIVEGRITDKVKYVIENLDNYAEFDVSFSEAVEGATLTADVDVEDVDGTKSIETQWYMREYHTQQYYGAADLVKLENQNSKSLLLDATHVGDQPVLEVVHTDNFGSISTRYFSADIVSNVNEKPFGAVRLIGEFTQNNIIHLDYSEVIDPDDEGISSLIGLERRVRVDWLVDGVVHEALGGQESIELTQEYVGKTLQANLTYYDRKNDINVLTSDVSEVIKNMNDVPIGLEVDVQSSVTGLGGRVFQGDKLSANTTELEDEDGIGELFYQWYSNASPLPGATGKALILDQSTVGKTITLVVSYIDDFQIEEKIAWSSEKVLNINDEVDGKVVITGSPKQGHTLKASTASVVDPDGFGEFNYTWLANGAALQTGPEDSFLLLPSHVGLKISVEVSYTDDGGEFEKIESAQTSIIENVNDLPTGSISIRGGTKPGEKVQLFENIRDLDGLGHFQYQWYSDGLPISNAKNETFTITNAVAGTALTASITFTDGGGTKEEVFTDQDFKLDAVNSSFTFFIPTENSPPMGTLGLHAIAFEPSFSKDGLIFDYIGSGLATLMSPSDATIKVSYDQNENTTLHTSGFEPYLVFDGEGYDLRNTNQFVVEAFENEAGDVTIIGFANFGLEQPSLIIQLSGPKIQITNQEELMQFLESYPEARQIQSSDDIPPDVALLVSDLASFEFQPPLQVHGTPINGSWLYADTSGLTDPDGLGALNYQWMVDGAPIIGATSNQLLLEESHVGKFISVEISYEDGQGQAEVLTEQLSAPVTFAPSENFEQTRAPIIQFIAQDDVLTRSELLDWSILGTATENAQVFVKITGDDEAAYVKTTADTEGNWVVTGEHFKLTKFDDLFIGPDDRVPNGLYSVTAWASTREGGISEKITHDFKLDVANTPSAPEVTSFANDGILTRSEIGSFDIIGRAEPSNIVSVSLDGDQESEVLEVVADSKGTWKISAQEFGFNSIDDMTIDGALIPDGVYSFSLQARDNQGLLSEEVTSTFQIALQTNPFTGRKPEAPTIAAIAEDNVLTIEKLASWMITGTAEVGHAVSLVLRGNEQSDPITVVADERGQWEITGAMLGVENVNDLMLDGALLPDGSYTLDVFATDDTGIQSDIISSEFLLQIANSPHLQDDVYHYEFLDTQTVDDLAGSDELIVQRSDNAGNIFFKKLYYDVDGKLAVEGSRDGKDYSLSAGGIEYFTWLHDEQSGETHKLTLGVSGENNSLSDRLYVGTLADDMLMTGTGAYVEAYGADGDDIIIVQSTQGSWANGDMGNDILVGGLGNDQFIGDSMSETGGDDVLVGNEGNDNLDGSVGNDILDGGAGSDVIYTGDGINVSYGGTQDDSIYLVGNGNFNGRSLAWNVSSVFQVGTDQKLVLRGKTKFEDVVDGGTGVDTVHLTKNDDAIFIHDSFSDFHESIALEKDTAGHDSTERLLGIEQINAAAGDDLIDLTSVDYSSAGKSIRIDGGLGNDVIWGSDANEIMSGGAGEDVLFGGAGINELTGGEGADEFQFTMTSENDTLTDFSLSDRDILKFFNSGGAAFDRTSLELSGSELSIHYSTTDSITITMENTDYTLEDLSASIFIV